MPQTKRTLMMIWMDHPSRNLERIETHRLRKELFSDQKLRKVNKNPL